MLQWGNCSFNLRGSRNPGSLMALGAFAPDLYLVTETETPALSFNLSLSNRESRRGASREPSATWSATIDVLSPVSALNRARCRGRPRRDPAAAWVASCGVRLCRVFRSALTHRGPPHGKISTGEVATDALRCRSLRLRPGICVIPHSHVSPTYDVQCHKGTPPIHRTARHDDSRRDPHKPRHVALT